MIALRACWILGLELCKVRWISVAVSSLQGDGGNTCVKCQVIEYVFF
eukprot:COSAG02_NODE_2509_length_8631_cov_52.246484_3_plen_47_part_00